MLSFQSEILWSREWENLIVTDVKLSKWDFYFLCRLLLEISVVYSKVWNDIANILCSILHSRLLNPTILKFSFMFIQFRYNLSFRVYVDLYAEFTNSLLKISRTIKEANKLVIQIQYLLVFWLTIYWNRHFLYLFIYKILSAFL